MCRQARGRAGTKTQGLSASPCASAGKPSLSVSPYCSALAQHETEGNADILVGFDFFSKHVMWELLKELPTLYKYFQEQACWCLGLWKREHGSDQHGLTARP